MIYVGENKAVICKGDFHPAQFYKGDKKIAGYTVENFEGADGVTLENCYNDKVYDAYLRGKNLFDANAWYPDYINDEGGITYTNKDVVSIHRVKILQGQFKENTQYTISLDYDIYINGSNSVSVYICHTDGSLVRKYISTNGRLELSSNSGKTIDYLYMGYSTSTVEMNVKFTNMQIEEGTTATECEPPLTDATITVRGKNLLDVTTLYPDYANGEGGITYGINDVWGIYSINMFEGWKEETQYTFSANYEVNADNNRVNLRVEYTDGTSKGFWTQLGGMVTGYKSGYGSMTTEAGKTVQKMVLAFSTQSGTLDVKLTNMQLEEGTKTGYEPYMEPQTIPFENGNLASDIPTFRGTTVIEIESDVLATISGKYKKTEEE